MVEGDSPTPGELGSEAEEPRDTLGPGEADLSDDVESVRAGPGLASTADLAPEHLRGALEALILVSDKPVAAVRLARLTGQDLGSVRLALGELAREYEQRGIVLDEIAGGFQFRTSPRFAPFVRMLVQQKPTRLSRAQLEVLSIIAYRQPVTRPEIDDVRGVDSGSAMKTLLERNLVKIIGKKEEVGRPILYGTSQEFLELFGLKNLRDLPTLREFAELTQESRDIFERRIGEALPGQGQGMDMQTHFDGAAAADEAELHEQRRAEEEQRAREASDGAEEARPAGAVFEGAEEDVERSAEGVVREEEQSARGGELDGDELDGDELDGDEHDGDEQPDDEPPERIRPEDG